MSFPQSVFQSFLALYGFGARAGNRTQHHRNGPITIGRPQTGRF